MILTWKFEKSASRYFPPSASTTCKSVVIEVQIDQYIVTDTRRLRGRCLSPHDSRGTPHLYYPSQKIVLVSSPSPRCAGFFPLWMPRTPTALNLNTPSHVPNASCSSGMTFAVVINLVIQDRLPLAALKMLQGPPRQRRVNT